MGATASITSLSAEELGAGVASLGAAYVPLQKEIEDNGITGQFLFDEVKDDENAFKSFVADNLGVTKPLQQKVLLNNYLGKLAVDGDGNTDAAASAQQFDVRDTVQRPPSAILSELFQIQGIPLDPDNVAAAADKIAAAVTAAVGDKQHALCDGESTFDCFISYRVAADKDIAEKLYLYLSSKGLFPFLDKVKLKDGMPWKDGFLQGLKGSKCFVSVVSRKALEPCREKARNHTWDNVLLEIETALRYKNATGNAAYIIPVFVGEIVTVEGAQMLRKFADFGGGMYADTIEGAVVGIGAAGMVPASAPASAIAPATTRTESNSVAAPAASLMSALPTPAKMPATGPTKTWQTQGKCVATWTGHTNDVFSVVQLADGRVASGSLDRTIKVWDPTTSTCVATWAGHSTSVNFVALLTDGRIASGSDDKSIKVWDPTTSTCVATWTGHTDVVRTMAHLANSQVASGSSDKTIKVWNPTTSTCVATWTGHSGSVYSIVQLVDGRVASGSGDKSIKVWDPTTSTCVATWLGHTDLVRTIVQLADGRVVSGCDDKTIKVWDPTTSTCVATWTGHVGYVRSVVQLVDGRVASGSGDKTIKVWDPTTSTCVATWTGHTKSVLSIVQLADGRVVSSSGDKTVKVWE